MPSSKIDFPAFHGFANYCFGEGFQYNRVRESAESVYETVADIAAAGRGFICFVDGKWSVRWWNPNDPIVQHFTPRNSWNFSSERFYVNKPHALRVKFLNEDKNFKEDERIVYADGYAAGNATIFESVE